MILILTDKNDIHAETVIQKLILEGLPFYRFNLDVESLHKTFTTFSDGRWKVIQNEVTLEPLDITCVWSRRTFVELLLNEQYDQSVDFKIWKNEWNKVLLGIYISLRDKQWLNPWRKAYEAENKYLQMEIAIKHGFNVPPTICSNIKTELISFARKFDNVVLKLMHQDFYKMESGEFKGLYVNVITAQDLNSFKEIEENPIVLQKYIEKDFEVRYTAIGDEHFACKIESQKSEHAKIDWRRYDIPNTPHSKIEPPPHIIKKVSLFMKDLSLEYGALDFVVGKDNEWHFLEINSMGQFLWIEDLSGHDITGAIINWFKKHLTLTLNKNNNESIRN